MTRFLATTLAAGSLLLAGSAAVAADAHDQARQIAEKVTADGAALFDACDAHAMAATYDEKAVLVVYQRKDGEVGRDVRLGREKIEGFYADLFKQPETIKSKNTVDRARLLAPDVLTIDGTFDTNTLKSDSIKVPFHQVRQKKDGEWLVLTMEISLLSME